MSMTSPVTVESTVEVPSYHPEFAPGCYPDDVLLVSSEGTSFHVPTYALMNSGFFRTMLSLPQGPASNATETWTVTDSSASNSGIITPAHQQQSSSSSKNRDAIHTGEDVETLTTLLLMLCGKVFRPWTSFDKLEAVLFLADKWDVPGVISIIRSAVTSAVLLQDPLRLYVIATRFGWTEEAKIASGRTLNLCLYDDAHKDTLSRLSSRDLLALLELHRARRVSFKKLLDCQDAFNVGNNVSGVCMACGKPQDNHTWRDLKAAMVNEMDTDPSGESLFGNTERIGILDDSKVALDCWRAFCMYCKKENYDKKATLESIRACVKGLKSTV